MDRAVETVETTLTWPIVLARVVFRTDGLGNVPLASHVAAIPSRPEHFRDGLALTIEVALVAGVAPIIHHVADACLMGVEAG